MTLFPQSTTWTSPPLPNESKRNRPYQRPLKKLMRRWPFYTKNVLMSVESSMSICQLRETFLQRFSPRYSGFQHAIWISENLNCTRSRYGCFSDSALFSFPPFIVALVFSNARRGCVSVEVDLNKLPHESMLLIFQRHRAQIRALRVYLSYDDTPCNGWDRVAHYFSEPTEWPNLTELWVCSPPDVDLPGLMFLVPGADSFHYCRREQDNLVWCAPMNQLTVLRLHDQWSVFALPLPWSYRISLF